MPAAVYIHHRTTTPHTVHLRDAQQKLTSPVSVFLWLSSATALASRSAEQRAEQLFSLCVNQRASSAFLHVRERQALVAH